MRTLALASFMLFATSIASQSLVVPSGFGSLEGPSSRCLPGLAYADRQQTIVDGALLGGMIGHHITAILFRRDGGQAEPFTPAVGQIAVRIGPAAFAASEVRSDFTANAPAAIEVYRGVVLAPASAPNGAVPDWSPSKVIRIDLSAPFAYAGGGLVVDVEGLGAAGADWPIDACGGTEAGALTILGRPCGISAGLEPNASVGPSTLVVGRTSNFVLVDEAGAPAWLMLGLAPLPVPVDLGVFGWVGCELHLDPMIAIPSAISPAGTTQAVFGGAANVRIQWPSDPGVCAARIVAQWVEIQSTGLLATSNALVCDLASTPPASGMVNLTSRAGETPIVQSFAVPVIGFEID